MYINAVFSLLICRSLQSGSIRLTGKHRTSNLCTIASIQLTRRRLRAFNFGIPSLPWINGRDLAGLVLQVPRENSRVRVGDIVLVPSTDYRDIRKAAFQEYAIATDFNAARIPSSASIHASASLGVAFVASVLALGVSFGLDFSILPNLPGPNLPQIINELDRNDIPADIKDECYPSRERLQRGDWVAIWGGKKYNVPWRSRGYR
jgi:NADPH:quinone reductase-like Zn-dependent oxidoreductase